jgi:hypothetical protein
MTSKLPQKKNSQKNSQIMFQTCVIDQKVQRKKPCYILKTFFECNYSEHQNKKYYWYYWNFKIYGTQ